MFISVLDFLHLNNYYIIIIIIFIWFVKFFDMKKLTIEEFVLILIVFACIIAFLTRDLTITFNKDLFSNIWINSIEKQVSQNLENLENVTWTLYYSPVNSRSAFSKSLSSADDIVKIQTYEFTKKEIKQILKSLLEKWVIVELIMENNKYQQYQNTRKQIEEYFSDYPRFQMRSDEQMWTLYTHSKIALIDSWFWIQTANLTHSSFFNNREHFFYSENTGVRNSLYDIFDKDWNGESIELDDIHPNLVVCNINCRAVIENLLSNAEKSILIQSQYILDENILEILKEKSDELDDMRFIVSDTDSNDFLIEYFGPWVARKFSKYYNHTKMILVDDEKLLLWSMNLSDTSLDKNREIWIILIDSWIISQYKDLFENDRKNSK